jgi:two-component system, NarL family, sensor histidine kinase FusK
MVDLLLQEYKGNIQFTFSDNGKGADTILFGFGLHGMAERVQSLGGTLHVDSAIGEGFTVNISIPIGIKTGGGSHE